MSNFSDSKSIHVGCKDMNIYVIDLLKGKLTATIEAHWSKISNILKIEGSQKIVTVSDKSIKVWSNTEYDEVETIDVHTSTIVYVDCIERTLEKIIMISIDASFRFVTWNLSTVEMLYSNTLPYKNDKGEMLDICVMDKDKEFLLCSLNMPSLVLFSMKSMQLLYSFKPFNLEPVIDLKALKRDKDRVLFIVTTFTSCILYELQQKHNPKECKLVPITEYYISARTQFDITKQNQKNQQGLQRIYTKYQFTTCQIIADSFSQVSIPEKVKTFAETNFASSKTVEETNALNKGGERIDNDVSFLVPKTKENAKKNSCFQYPRKKTGKGVRIFIGDSRGCMHALYWDLYE